MDRKNIGAEIKKAAALAAAALVLLAAAPPALAAGNPFAEAVSTIAGSLKKNGVPVADGDVIGLADPLILRYDFTLAGQKFKDIQALVAGKVADPGLPDVVYPLVIPNKLRFQGSDTVPLIAKVEISKGNYTDYKFGVLTYDTTGASVKFEGEFWDSNYGIAALADAYVEMGCTLDGNAIGGAETAKIDLTASDSVSVTVRDNQKTEHKLEKTGSYSDTTRRFTWTVTYTPGTRAAAYPLLLQDDLGAGHVLVPGTVAYAGGSATLAANTAAPPASVSGTVLTIGPIEGTDADAAITAKKSFVFTYETVLTDAELANTAADTTVANTAKLFEGGTTTQVGNTATATATAQKASKTFLTKTGKQSPLDSRVIDWSITLNTNDRNLKDLVLYDSYPDGLGKPENVEVNGHPLNDQAPGHYGESLDSAGAPGASPPYRFKITFPPGGGYENSYEITYSTRVKDSYFDESAPKPEFDNSVWLSFDWYAYGGTGLYSQDHTTPTVTKTGQVASSVLEKRGTYSRSDHTITWELVVNPHKVNVTAGTITDPLAAVAGKTMTYVDGSLEVKDSSGQPVSTSSGPITLDTAAGTGSTPQNLVLNVGNIGTQTYTVTFKTTVDDPAHFAYNNGTPNNAVEYTNTATFNGMVLPSGAAPGQEQPVLSPAAGTVPVVSQVIAKTAGSYNPATRELAWTITVNQNKMPMDAAVVTDVLPEYLSFVSCTPVGSFAPAPAVTPPGPGSRTVTIDFGSGFSDTRAVTLVTRVDPDALAAFKSNTDVAVENTATLARSVYTGPASATAGKSIANQMLDKSGKLDAGKDFISYSVNINPNRLTLPAGLRASDALPAGLKLAPASVKLYEATVGADGGFTKATQVQNCGLQIDPATGGFSVLLPAGAKAYVLEYTCDVLTTNGVLQNNISFTGGGFSGAAKADGCDVNVAGAGGGGSASRRGRAVVTAEDRNAPGTFLVGAVYDLLADYGSGFIVVDRQTVAADGTMTFTGLSFGETYKLQAVSLVGYEHPEVGHTALDGFSFTIPSNPGTYAFTVLHDLPAPPGPGGGAGAGGAQPGGTLPRTGQQTALPLALAAAGALLVGLGLAGLRRQRRA